MDCYVVGKFGLITYCYISLNIIINYVIYEYVVTLYYIFLLKHTTIHIGKDLMIQSE